MQLIQVALVIGLATARPLVSLHQTLAVDDRSAKAWLRAPGPKCHDRKVVDSNSTLPHHGPGDKFVQCPKDCPIFADDRADGVDCNFECVEATPKAWACSAVNPKEPDVQRGICRACIIYGCQSCTTEGQDTCAVCSSGYRLTADGKCENANMMYWYGLFALLGLVTAFIVAWIVDIAVRPVVNADGLKGALDARSRSKARANVASDSVQPQECKEVDVVGILKSIKTCPDAYAIFESEAARDAAVDISVQSGGRPEDFHGNVLKLNASRVEPQTVNWRNCANTDLMAPCHRGYNIQMFVGLAGSHVYIYFFDHYRVLRSIQSCNYADKMVDWWTQWMMSIPCGFMLACVVFKANCQPGYPCVDGDTMVAGCAVAFVAHIILHTLALKFLVPMFGLTGESDGADSNTYQDCSRHANATCRRIACSWFNVNPVYCLRSQYIYQHNPPCVYCIPGQLSVAQGADVVGKEHLIEVNEDLGLYFNDCPAKEEDYDAPHVDVDAVKENLKASKIPEDELKSKATEQFEDIKGKASGHLEELRRSHGLAASDEGFMPRCRQSAFYSSLVTARLTSLPSLLPEAVSGVEGKSLRLRARKAAMRITASTLTPLADKVSWLMLSGQWLVVRGGMLDDGPTMQLPFSLQLDQL
eukprot:Skav217890  [mRNA]  locus=scaffold67:217360:240797:+ [translate_table: standard]